MAAPAYHFRLATDAPGDTDALRRLNHRTFAEEIPQHAPAVDGRLRDRFEDASTTVVAERRVDGLPGEIVGMLSLRSERPFSLDAKLSDLDAHLPPGAHPCEVRLLAVDPAHRSGIVFRGLVAALASVGLARGHDLALISGTTRQSRLYRHLGFEPFGPLVGTAEAPYQPMRLTREAFARHAATFAPERPHGAHLPVQVEATSVFLPGPVTLAPGVREAFAAPLVSHRSADFVDALARLRRRLCALTGARDVQVLVGTGTLANDVVAGQLRALGGRGVVLACGEFGERLADHARRWGLDAHVERRAWGETFCGADVADVLDRAAGGDVPTPVRWLWAPLCETSSGALLPLGDLKAACAARGVALALDAVSAIGSVPVDLGGVAFASATSGKGLGGPPGLALVFHAAPPRPTPDVPRYLDLGLYAASDGVAFTHQSALVAALGAALDACPGDAPERLAAVAARLRASLHAAGFETLGDPATTSPAVTTVALPPPLASLDVGAALARRGFEVSCRSGYLVARNAVQVCLMGHYPAHRLDALVEALTSVCACGDGAAPGAAPLPAAPPRSADVRR